ncbi:MAG: tetratricopeptide repeat protein [Planctomycetota bacterium]
MKPAPRPHDGSPQHGSNLPSEDTAPRPHAADADRGDDHGGDPPADGGDQETDQGNHRDRERSDSRSWHSDSRSWRGSSWCNCWDWWFTGNCWHHWHFGIDPWFCCGSWFGWSWGYVFCGDPWNPWVWYYRPRYGASVYVYYPYPYHTYSYVNLDYVDETKTYPPLPSETYVDAAADLEQLLGQGKQLFRQADYLGAAEAFRQAILKDLTNPIAKFGYAHALFALGNYPFAALAIRLGMKLLPEWPILGGGLRDLYGKPDDLDGHLQALDHYLAQRPDDPAALLVLGYAQYFSGNLDRAAAAFERLTQLDAGDDVARRFLESANAIKAGQVAPPPATSTPPAPAKDH